MVGFCGVSELEDIYVTDPAYAVGFIFKTSMGGFH